MPGEQGKPIFHGFGLSLPVFPDWESDRCLPSHQSGSVHEPAVCRRTHHLLSRRNQVSQKPSRAGLFLCRRAFSFVLKRPLNINLVVGQDNAGYEALQDAPFLVLISEVPYFRSVGPENVRISSAVRLFCTYRCRRCRWEKRIFSIRAALRGRPVRCGKYRPGGCCAAHGVAVLH